MGYNTEKINGIAEQLVKRIGESLKQREKAGQPTIADLEREFRDILRQIGVKALGLYLSGLQTTPEHELRCSSGGRHHYQRMREAKIISVFGAISYKRAYYAGCKCAKGKAPLDEREMAGRVPVV